MPPEADGVSGVSGLDPVALCQHARLSAVHFHKCCEHLLSLMNGNPLVLLAVDDLNALLCQSIYFRRVAPAAVDHCPAKAVGIILQQCPRAVSAARLAHDYNFARIDRVAA